MNALSLPPIEFNRRKTVSLGSFVVADKTRALFRQQALLRLHFHFYLIDKGQRVECNSEAISLHPCWQAFVIRREGKNFEIPVNGETNVGDLVFDIYLDMSKINTVYQSTDYVLELVVQEQNERVSQPYDLQFCIHENREEAFLVVENNQTQIANDRILFQASREFLASIEGEYETAELAPDEPITHLKNGKITVLDLSLRNAASHALGSEEAPENIIFLTKPEFNFVPKREDLLSCLIVDQRGRPVSQKSLRLLPQQDYCLSLRLDLNHDVNRAFFDEVTYRGQLNLGYIQPPDTKEKKVSIPFSFSTTPWLGEEVIAVDFGTSAIAAAHVRAGSEDIMDLYAQFPESAKQFESERTYSSAEDLRSMETVPFIKNEFHRAVDPEGLEEPDYRLESGKSNDSKREFEEITLLKSRIAACQINYWFSDGDVVKMADLMGQFYQRLNQEYFLPIRDCVPCERIVLTHPNSYITGQINFLKEHVKHAIPGQPEVQTISESDAVIYHYLENLPAEKNASEDYENILCYDMGAGTLDISFRQVQFGRDEDNGIRYPIKDNSAQLLGMLSIAGAGNELDELLASAIEHKLQQLDAEHLRVFGKNSEDEFDRPQIMVLVTGDEREQRLQEVILNRLHDDLKAAKVAYANDPSNPIVISMDIQVENDYLFVISPEFTEQLQAANFLADNGLKFDIERGSIQFILTAQELDKLLAQEYLDKHLYQPMMAILRDKASQQQAVHTVIISGRGAIFPNVHTAITAYLDEHLPDANVITERQDIAKMKAIVAEGALAWGQDAFKGETLFDSPRMHGVIGLALLNNNGKWSWQPLLLGSVLNQSINQRQSEQSLPFNPQSHKKALILQTAIRDPELAEDWLNQHIRDKKRLQQQITSDDYFSLLYLFDKRHFPRKDNQVKLRVTPYLPEDGALYGRVNEDGFLNVRIGIELIPSSGPARILGPFDISQKTVARVRKNWPWTILDKIRKASKARGR